MLFVAYRLLSSGSREGGAFCGDQVAEYIPEYHIGDIFPDRLSVVVRAYAGVGWLVLCAWLSGGIYFYCQCGYFADYIPAFSAGYDTRTTGKGQFCAVKADVEIFVPDPDFRDCRYF